MKHTVQHNHDADSILDALGVDKEKLTHLLSHLIKAKDHFKRDSQFLSEVIRVCSTPEEIVIIMNHLLRSGAIKECEKCPLEDISPELIEAVLLKDLLEDLLKHRKDGTDTKE